jgi:S-formylglutathione hydrolase FrmB
MHGRLLTFEIDSQALAGNPLGDPVRRPLFVYLPPGHADGHGLPAVYFLHGFTGSARGWFNVSPWSPTVPERLDALVVAGEVPPLCGVFIDGWTALGGSQWTNSSALGRYQDYVADDVVGFVERTVGTRSDRRARAIVGKSSGGYGALRMGRDRPEVFAHLACHAGDAGFEWCYGPDLPRAAGALLAAGGVVPWLEAAVKRARETKLSNGDHPVLNVIAMSAAYSPDPGAPLGLALPFELETGRMRPEVWARWVAQDPARFVGQALGAYRRMETLFLDCGARDEFNLRWGARQVSESLGAGGVPHRHEEFEDGHMGINYRYDRSLRLLGPRLARG